MFFSMVHPEDLALHSVGSYSLHYDNRSLHFTKLQRRADAHEKELKSQAEDWSETRIPRIL